MNRMAQPCADNLNSMFLRTTGPIPPPRQDPLMQLQTQQQNQAQQFVIQNQAVLQVQNQQVFQPQQGQSMYYRDENNPWSSILCWPEKGDDPPELSNFHGLSTNSLNSYSYFYDPVSDFSSSAMDQPQQSFDHQKQGFDRIEGQDFGHGMLEESELSSIGDGILSSVGFGDAQFIESQSPQPEILQGLEYYDCNSNSDWLQGFIDDLQLPETEGFSFTSAFDESSSELAQHLGLQSFNQEEEELWRDQFGICSLDQEISMNASSNSAGSFGFLGERMYNNMQGFESQVQVWQKNPNFGESTGQNEGNFQMDRGECRLQLIQCLLDSAQDIDLRKETADRSLMKLRELSSPYGDPMQRVASYFADGFACRLTETVPMPLQHEDEAENFAIAYRTLNDACPYIKFAHLTANQVILEVTESAQKVHIVDYGIVQGIQWAALFQAFATGNRPAPKIIISGIPSSNSAKKSVAATGKRLAEFASLLDLQFQFRPILVKDEERIFDPAVLQIEEDEVVILNLMMQPADVAPQAIELAHLIRPKVVTLAQYESHIDGSTFQARILNAAYFYSAIFDSLDAAMPRDDPQRANIEQLYFAGEIRRIASSSSSHPDNNGAWQTLLITSGLQRSRILSSYAISQARCLLWLYCENFNVVEGPGSLSLSWLDRPIVTVSAWHCS